MWRRATNVLWWIGVSLYFGGLVALGAVAAPGIQKGVEQGGVTMGGFASPPLVMRAEVTGQLFGVVLGRFTVVEVIALGLMLAGLAGFLFAHTPVRRSVWVLLTMWILLAGILAYDAGVLRGRIYAARDRMWQTAGAHAGEGFNAVWPERTAFGVLHARAEALGRAKAYLLLGMILVAGWKGLAERPLKHAKTRGELMREAEN